MDKLHIFLPPTNKSDYLFLTHGQKSESFDVMSLFKIQINVEAKTICCLYNIKTSDCRRLEGMINSGFVVPLLFLHKEYLQYRCEAQLIKKYTKNNKIALKIDFNNVEIHAMFRGAKKMPLTKNVTRADILDIGF